MKVSELIQTLLDIQHLAGEDIEIKSVSFDEYKDEFKDIQIILPILMHHPDSLEQVCIFGITDDMNMMPEKGSHHLIRSLDDSWQYGKCDVKWIGYLQEEGRNHVI